MPMRTSWKLNVAQCDVIPKISMTTHIVINVPTRALLDGDTKVSFVPWLANLKKNIFPIVLLNLEIPWIRVFALK